MSYIACISFFQILWGKISRIRNIDITCENRSRKNFISFSLFLISAHYFAALEKTTIHQRRPGKEFDIWLRCINEEFTETRMLNRGSLFVNSLDRKKNRSKMYWSINAYLSRQNIVIVLCCRDFDPTNLDSTWYKRVKREKGYRGSWNEILHLVFLFLDYYYIRDKPLEICTTGSIGSRIEIEWEKKKRLKVEEDFHQYLTLRNHKKYFDDSWLVTFLATIRRIAIRFFTASTITRVKSFPGFGLPFSRYNLSTINEKGTHFGTYTFSSFSADIFDFHATETSSRRPAFFSLALSCARVRTFAPCITSVYIRRT